MRKFLNLVALLTLVSAFAVPAAVRACPSCSSAIPESSGAEEEDRQSEALAYNHSIYLMVSVPYLLLGGVGFMVYRGLRQQARAEHLPEATEQQHGTEGSPCSTPSRVEGS